MIMKQAAALERLLQCHATPGDESEVAVVLQEYWLEHGLVVRAHGGYALSAATPDPDPAAPTLLVTAHMDTPGFIVERREAGRAEAIPLGTPRFAGDRVAAVLKTGDGKVPVALLRSQVPDAEPRFLVEDPENAAHQGDRICYRPVLDRDSGGLITAPFLDNRLGCWLLCVLAGCARRPGTGVNLVLGATGCEEMGGFGAPVLARAVAPDMVICVDATYEAPEQGVCLGAGPVLTLSDASVLLNPALVRCVRERLQTLCLPLQAEVYNVSGTDARAFPYAGLEAPVVPVLLATRGNHSPREQASLADLDAWQEVVTALAAGDAVRACMTAACL